MPRGSRQSQASQSQQPSQSQARPRNSRRARVEEDPEEDVPATQGPADDDEMSVDEDRDIGDEIRRCATELVRLALFCEQRRVPVRRDDITKKILSQHPRLFSKIFPVAQHILRTTFGMELIEVPTRAALAEEAMDAEEQTQSANRYRRKASSGSKTWILRSTLDPRLIQAAAQKHSKIFEEEIVARGILFPDAVDDDAGGDDDQGERYPQDHGTLISWTKCDQLGAIGIVYVVLALILVSSRSMPDGDLRRALTSLHLPFNKEGVNAHRPVQYTTSSSVRSHTMEEFLSLMLKQNYVDRVQVGSEASKKGPKATTSKRVRTQEQEDEGRAYEWRWGPRAHVEIGEEAIGAFIADFMVLEKARPDDDPDGRTPEQQEAALAKMLKGIEAAAGGSLAPLR